MMKSNLFLPLLSSFLFCFSRRLFKNPNFLNLKDIFFYPRLLYFHFCTYFFTVTQYGFSFLREYDRSQEIEISLISVVFFPLPYFPTFRLFPQLLRPGKQYIHAYVHSYMTLHIFVHIFMLKYVHWCKQQYRVRKTNE